MIRFSIWSLMPRPWRPPIALASMHELDAVVERLAVDRDRPALREARRATTSGSISTPGSQWATPMIGSTMSIDRVEQLELLRLVRGAPDVRVGRVRLLGASRGRADRASVSHSLISAAPAELVDELGVQPRLVDAQVRVGEQPVAVEALDVVALVRRAVAPDVHVVVAHRVHQQRARSPPARAASC